MEKCKCAEEQIAHKLRDAGCDEETVQEFLRLHAQGRKQDILRLLTRQRAALLCRIHDLQKPLDVLDYLLCKYKKDGEL